MKQNDVRKIINKGDFLKLWLNGLRPCELSELNGSLITVFYCTKRKLNIHTPHPHSSAKNKRTYVNFPALSQNSFVWEKVRMTFLQCSVNFILKNTVLAISTKNRKLTSK